MINKKYMMFLKKDQLFGNYYGAIEPFAITFDENNKADLQTNIETINESKMSSKAQLAGKTIVLKMKYMKLLLTILAVRPLMN